MRTFIAIDLPEEVKEELRKSQKELKGAKLSITKDFHITLKFLGELTLEKVDEVRKRLNTINANRLEASISSIGFFPDSSKIRVIWAGIEPEQEILELQSKVDDALEGLFPMEKDYKCHITLARVKFADNKKQLKDSIDNIAIQKIKFGINCLSLKKSTLTKQGPIYEEVDAKTLK